MRIDGWTLALQTLNVAILIWILARYLFAPIAAIIAERRDAACKTLDDAAARSRQADEALARARAEEESLAAKRDLKLRQAQDEAEAAARTLLDAARAEAARDLAEAKAEAERQANEQRRRIEARGADLAADIASTLLKRLPPSALVAGFERGLADALEAMPAGSRAQLAADAGPWRLKAARALTETELARVGEALARGLGCAPALAPEVDPDLIAGLEIETSHARIGNSLRGDLSRIRKELAEA